MLPIRIKPGEAQLTRFYSRTNEDGTLGVYGKATNKEVPNNDNPSKRKILLAALEDLGGDMSGKQYLMSDPV